MARRSSRKLTNHSPRYKIFRHSLFTLHTCYKTQRATCFNIIRDRFYLLVIMLERTMGNLLAKSAAVDFSVQWLLWAVAATMKTEKFYDLAGAYRCIQWVHISTTTDMYITIQIQISNVYWVLIKCTFRWNLHITPDLCLATSWLHDLIYAVSVGWNTINVVRIVKKIKENKIGAYQYHYTRDLSWEMYPGG
jgi:hypothetical protein